MQGASNDDLQDESQQSAGAFDDEREYPIDRVRRRLSGSLGGRPLMVYLVLFAGTAVLLILLVIVWISATGGDDKQRPTCFNIAVNEAEAAILAGDVTRAEVTLDQQQPLQGLTKIVLYYRDGQCRELPEGADYRGDLYRILGVIAIYNQASEQPVRVRYIRQAVPRELLATSTPTPTVTPTPSPTSTPSPVPTETSVEIVASPAAVDTPTATWEPTPSPVPTTTFTPTPLAPASPAATSLHSPPCLSAECKVMARTG